MKYLNLKHTALALSLVGAFSGAHATALLTNAITLISNSSYNGTARTAVYDTGTGLDFYYQFTNNASSRNGVERFTGYDYSSLGASAIDVFQTSAAFGIFTAGTEPSDYADRTDMGVIGFSFVPNGFSKVNPGTTSFTQIVRTNARNYQAGSFGLLNGIGDNATGFATATPVPEPETYAMLLSGLALMGAIVRRRAAKKDADNQA